MKVLKLLVWLVAALVSLALLAIAIWHVTDDTPAPAQEVSARNSFDSELLVLVDGDMTATAYADAQLHPVDDPRDLLLRFDGEITEVAEASNTVMGWPGATAVVGGRALVVESRGPAPRDRDAFETSVYEEMPFGTRLHSVDLRTGERDVVEVCRQPMSVDVAPGGNWALVACGDDAGELAVVVLSGGVPTDVRRLDPDLSIFPRRPWDEGAGYAVVHPGGAAAAVLSANTGVTLVRFTLDADGIPEAVEAEDTIALDGYVSMARWSPTGRHLLVADVGWGMAPTDALTNGPGAILSIALDPDGEARGVVSRAVVGKSPEAFELDRDGTLLAVVNMERSYLPGGPLALVPGRSASSLSLVAFDPATGELETLGAPVGFRGVLPEDAAFDADGDSLAVVVYQDHDAPLSDGWLAFFDIDRTGARPVARLTDRRVALPRGGHDLVALDATPR